MLIDMDKSKKNMATGKPPVRFLYYFLIPAGFFCIAAIIILALLLPVALFGSPGEVVVNIAPEAPARQVGELLQQKKLVRSAVVFSLYARWKGLDGQIKAGEYSLSNGLSTPAVLSELVDGCLAVQAFTIPEGFTTAQIADLLVSKGLIDRERFYWAVANETYSFSFIQGLPNTEKRLEGYLFPDTYQVFRGYSESAIIEMMLQRFTKEINDLDYITQARKAGLTLHQAVTLASLLEREAGIEEERPLIAGVILNRMAKSMPLQVDATVQYALGTHQPKVYYKDLQVNSPYNTYRVQGLPPGPIAAPGRSSLLAAVRPQATSYLYYVARPDGFHAFANTLAEHNLNKERYLP
ncbi:MAG: putative aminodeoxychorismate lyase [Pelotomaculum sp. PtaB.Bin104]|nr:MAG: putative aminodeoxychorismate lyase [Pelotomaculum sp. PtaB.Bin104]